MDAKSELEATLLTRKQCSNCGRLIEWGGSYKRYYCSEACWDEAHTRFCIVCNSPFASKDKRHGFCGNCHDYSTTQGQDDHPLLKTYRSMLHRCYNENYSNYKNYGAKGVRVCPEWILSFDAFCRDVGIRPNGTTLDRIDSTRGYSPENCRWCDVQHQRKNRGRFKNTSRKYRGVNPHGDKWVASVRFNSESYYLGTFDTAEGAAAAYNTKVLELYGEECLPSYLNEVAA